MTWKVHKRQRKSIIKNYEDLAHAMAAAYPTEKSISRAVYSATACGAWLSFTSGYPASYHQIIKRDWLLDIRRTIVGYMLVRGRLKTSDHWYKPEDLPGSIKQTLVEVDGLQQSEYSGKWYLTNEQTCRYIQNAWDNHPSKRQKYFLLPEVPMTWGELYAKKAKPRKGFTVGSIVEGVDWSATPITILFPCHDSKLYDAIKQVEDECQEIWDQTHGCEECGKDPETGKQHENEWGYISVDPGCPKCQGEGIAI